MLGYRFSPHGSTGKTPFELFKGRSPSTCVCPGWMCWGKGCVDNTPGEWREKEISIQCKRKEDFDSHKCVRNVEVGVGDFVKMKAPTGCADWSKFTRELQVIKCFKNAVAFGTRVGLLS